MYWRQTLVPMLHSLEDVWDQWAQRRGWPGYARFDLSKVPALQTDEREKAEVGRILVDMGFLPSAVNDRLGLGFDDEAAEAADTAATLPPLPDFGPPEDESGKRIKRLTKAEIRERSKASHPAIIQRNRRLAKLEGRTLSALKAVATEHRNAVVEIVRDAINEHGGLIPEAGRAAAMKIRELQTDLGREFGDAVAPSHVEAAQIGAVSIQELIDNKALPWHDRVKAVSFAPETERVMARRRQYLEGLKAASMIDWETENVIGWVTEAGKNGESTAWVEKQIREAWGGWARGQAATIAKTEVGTMYNTSRFEEMGEQGFTRTEWFTNIDEMTRVDEFDHAACDGEVRRRGENFPCGLPYPQWDGGAPGNVINCRCETMPAVED